MIYLKDKTSSLEKCPFYSVEANMMYGRTCMSILWIKVWGQEMLSSHIDKIHIGPGLLEGDKRKFWQESYSVHEFLITFS